MRFSDSDLRGREVIGIDGEPIGDLDGVVIDARDMRVDALRIRLSTRVADQLGAKHAFFRGPLLELPVRLVRSIGDSVQLAIGLPELRRQGYATPEESQEPVVH